MKPEDFQALQAQVDQVLSDPAHADNPLRDTLNEVWQNLQDSVGRLHRITHLSDSFQAMARKREKSMSQHYEQQLRRINRVVRISDNYQQMLRDLNLQLEEASYRDLLTGINNRRAMMLRLQQEAARADRTGTGFIIAMVDIDRFKHINDAYGHEVGDIALTQVAQILNTNVGPDNCCGRWGGEEFLLIFTSDSVDVVYDLLQAKRQAVRDLRLPGISHLEPHLSVSIGLAIYQPGEQLKYTLNRADVALYTAKNSGRDRISPSREALCQVDA